MNQIGWIDFSPSDRNKVKNVLALLAEPGTLDELGIGQIRDAYSDLLFPGISTIQTRAKYFILVPRILREYEWMSAHEKNRAGYLQAYLQKQENFVAKLLVEKNKDAIGIIGSTAVDTGGVKRRPSTVYWNGLRTFEIVKTELSLADFCRTIDRDADNYGEGIETDDATDDKDVSRRNSLCRIPDRDPNWMLLPNLDLSLSKKEAQFLKDKIAGAKGIANSVISQLLKTDLLDKVLASTDGIEELDFDLLVEHVRLEKRIDDRCKLNLTKAQEFSLAMEGPHILYNILLARINQHDHQVELYEEEYQLWLADVLAKNLFAADNARSWIDHVVLSGSRVSPSARDFVIRFGQLIQQKGTRTQLEECISKRSKQNKGDKSYLMRKLNNEGWVGMRRLTYRWGTARNILWDIQGGLHA